VLHVRVAAPRLEALDGLTGLLAVTEREKAIVDAFRDGYEGSLYTLATKLGIPPREVRLATVPLMVAGFIVMRPEGGFAWNGTIRKKTP